MHARRLKFEDRAAVYHCIGRIVGGSMLLGEPEKERFRNLMWRLAEFSGVEIITYCLMTNHVHLLVRVRPSTDLPDDEIARRIVRYYGRREPWVQTALDALKRTGQLSASLRQRLLANMGDVSMFMRTLKRRFTLWYNRRHKRFGTLWAERFKSLLVEDCPGTLRTIAMYIDLNPVRAGLVDDPKEYRYCGHAEALAGNREIRRQMAALSTEATWRKIAGEYRCAMMVRAGESRDPKKHILDRRKILDVLKRGGAIELVDVLRLRLRYFSDGVAFGSREFIGEVFEQFRDRFGQHRKSGARKMPIPSRHLDGLATLRDLRKNAVG